VDGQKSTALTDQSQYSLHQLVKNVRQVRERALRKHPRSKTGIAAGQFLILLLQVQKGARLPRKSLRGFFRFIARDPESFREEAP
jgi:hypothetical protein